MIRYSGALDSVICMPCLKVPRGRNIKLRFLAHKLLSPAVFLFTNYKFTRIHRLREVSEFQRNKKLSC